MPKDRLPGLVFISHSSTDKEFVRRLDGDLESRGFRTWLDEKALVVGDSLPGKISSGLADAAAVIFVVSPASENSDWLRYELHLATDRMVKGLRILPLLLGDATIPTELRGLLYADFRGNYETGLVAVIRSLEQLEATIAEQARVTMPWYKQTEDRLRNAFDGVGLMSVIGEYKSPDFDFVIVHLSEEKDVEITYDTAPVYRGSETKPVGNRFWREFQDAMEDSDSRYRMLISQRPLELHLPALIKDEPRILVDYDAMADSAQLHSQREYLSVSFALDFSDPALTDAEKEHLLGHVRERVVELEKQVESETDDDAA